MSRALVQPFATGHQDGALDDRGTIATWGMVGHGCQYILTYILTHILTTHIQEEQMLIDAHRQHGNRWSDIAKVIPGRPENHIKNYVRVF